MTCVPSKITASNNKGKGGNNIPQTLKAKIDCVFARFTIKTIKAQIPMPSTLSINALSCHRAAIGQHIKASPRCKSQPHTQYFIYRVNGFRLKKTTPPASQPNQRFIYPITTTPSLTIHPAANG